MNIFKQYVESEKEVFKNINYLDPDYLPEKFNYRENEIEAIASNMSPIFYGSQPINTVIIGTNATGKTTAIKKLLIELKNIIPETIPVYINCRKYHTEYSVYSQIYKEVLNKKPPQKGSSSQKIFTNILEALENTEQALIIALDDINYLLGPTNTASPHSQNIIRNLTRASENYNVTIGIYPVITSQEFKYQFDKEVNTLFIPDEVHFQTYTHQQYHHIIKQRSEQVFYEKIPDNIIERIVTEVEKDDNIRKAWYLLKKLGLEMKENNKKADIKILNKIIKQE